LPPENVWGLHPLRLNMRVVLVPSHIKIIFLWLLYHGDCSIRVTCVFVDNVVVDPGKNASVSPQPLSAAIGTPENILQESFQLLANTTCRDQSVSNPGQ